MRLIKVLLTIFMWCLVALPGLAFGKVEITSSSFDNAQKIFILTTPQKTSNLKIKKSVLSEPSRIFFDIENATLKDIKAKTELKNSGIKNIKIAQFSIRPNVVRVVFSGEDEALDAIRVTTLKNIIIFNLDDIRKSPTKTYLYKDLEPDLSEADYYCYYEKLNVTLSKNARAKKKSTTKKTKKKKSSKAATKKEIIDEEKWNEIKTVDFPAAFTINKIEKTKQGLKISGLGKVSIKSPFTLDAPRRLIVDFPDSSLKKKEFTETIDIGNGNKVRFGQFNKSTVRMVVETQTPNSFNTIISPDMRSILVQKEKELDPLHIPFLKSASLEKFEAKQLDKQTTKVTIRATSPIAHTLKKVDDGALIGIMNLDCTNGFLEETVPTKQFKTVHIVPMENNFKGTYWKFPLKSSSRINTELSADGQELNIYIKDKIFPSKDIIIRSGATVMIDAGHGGKDGGASRAGIHEKNLTLDLAKQLRTYLKSHGVRVFMTRYSDCTLSLKGRVYKVNRKRPDLFVSIHINSSKKPQIKGVETHWYGSSRTKRFAQIVHNNLALGVNTGDRGMFRSKFYVLRHTKVPAILVETGFISNKQERRAMLSKQRQQDTVKSLGNGILLYLAMKYEARHKARR